jgi:hypothetical protein
MASLPDFDVAHGTAAGYRRGCRCDDCRAAQAERIARQRERRGRPDSGPGARPGRSPRQRRSAPAVVRAGGESAGIAPALPSAPPWPARAAALAPSPHPPALPSVGPGGAPAAAGATAGHGAQWAAIRGRRGTAPAAAPAARITGLGSALAALLGLSAPAMPRQAPSAPATGAAPGRRLYPLPDDSSGLGLGPFAPPPSRGPLESEGQYRERIRGFLEARGR